MEIIVLGAGAIGSLYGAKLSPANQVTLIARPEHVAAINSHGLQVKGHDSAIVRLRAATKVEALLPDTLILLTTKVSASAAAIAPLASLLREDTTILCLQNGLGSEKIVRDSIGPRGTVLRAITQAGAILEGPGVINYTVIGDTFIESHALSKRIAGVFNEAGLITHISPDMKSVVWQKLIFNCVVNPITTILGREVGAIADSRLDPLKRLVIDECLAVAAADDVTFDVDLLARINQVFAPSRNIVSMQQDLQRGRTTEIDYLNGAVVSFGGQNNLACPVNEALVTIIKAMEGPITSTK